MIYIGRWSLGIDNKWNRGPVVVKYAHFVVLIVLLGSSIIGIVLGSVGLFFLGY